MESDEAARALWAMTPKPMPLQLAGGAINAAQEGDRCALAVGLRANHARVARRTLERTQTRVRLSRWPS